MPTSISRSPCRCPLAVEQDGGCLGGGVGLMMGCYGTDVIDGVDARWMAVMVFVIVGFCTFVW